MPIVQMHNINRPKCTFFYGFSDSSAKNKELNGICKEGLFGVIVVDMAYFPRLYFRMMDYIMGQVRKSLLGRYFI